jgi:hypothetical protein
MRCYVITEFSLSLWSGWFCNKDIPPIPEWKENPSCPYSVTLYSQDKYATCFSIHCFHFSSPADLDIIPLLIATGPRWRSWLRHCATNRQVAGSIPDGVSGIFHWRNPVGRTMALGSTQPLTEMSTRNLFWGVKAALPPSSADCLEMWEPRPPGTLWASSGL